MVDRSPILIGRDGPGLHIPIHGDPYVSRRHAEIVECYLLAGPADYILRVVYRDAADFERIHTKVLTQLPGVLRVQSALTLRTVKRTTALPI